MNRHGILLSIVIILSIVSSVMGDELETVPGIAGLEYAWIKFLVNGREVARVAGDCTIIASVPVGKYMQAELDRYRGICLEIRAIERSQRAKETGGPK